MCASTGRLVQVVRYMYKYTYILKPQIVYTYVNVLDIFWMMRLPNISEWSRFMYSKKKKKEENIYYLSNLCEIAKYM